MGEERNRYELVRRATRLVVALNARGASLGLSLEQVQEVLEVGRRGAYRWIEAIDGDPDLPYEWVGGGRGRPRAGRLRRIPRCLE